MIEARQGTVQLTGARLGYLEWGRRETGAATVLLLHGGSANAHWWDFVAPPLAAQNHVLALDLRGHGASGPSATREYSLDAHAADIAELAATLPLQRLILVGHSFGGFVALASVPALGARLQGLALIDSRGLISPRGARYLTTLGKFPQPVYSDEEDALRRFRLLPPATSASPEVLAHVTRHSIVRRDDGTWTLGFDRAALSAIVARDLQAEKSLVRCPCLLVRGAQSGALTQKGFSALASELPGARCVEIDDAYHHVMLDRPAVLAAHLAEFARRCAARAATGA